MIATMRTTDADSDDSEAEECTALSQASEMTVRLPFPTMPAKEPEAVATYLHQGPPLAGLGEVK